MSNPNAPQYQGGSQYQGAPVSSKNKTTAALLAFFLGSIGVHNFYLGEKQKGIIHIVLAVIGWVLYGIGIAQMGAAIASGDVSGAFSPMMIIGLLVLAANGIWQLVEFVQILMKSDAEFANTYR